MRTHAILLSTIFALIDCTLISARVIVTGKVRSSLLRKMVRVILVPGVPRIVRTALSKDIPRTGLSSRRVIRSPACKPAFAAGDPSIGLSTLTKPSSEVISIPRPANLPAVCSCISAKSFLSK